MFFRVVIESLNYFREFLVFRKRGIRIMFVMKVYIRSSVFFGRGMVLDLENLWELVVVSRNIMFEYLVFWVFNLIFDIFECRFEYLCFLVGIKLERMFFVVESWVLGI